MRLQSNVLGKGLGSLLPASRPGENDGAPLYVMLGRIHTRPEQPRQVFDEQGLRQLAVSIREQGILQPLVVSPNGTGSFVLIAGERRLRAARLAGLSEVPIIVRNVSSHEVFELALIENIQRQDLNPVEEAEAFRHLIDEHSYTQEALARRVGKDRTTISNALRLLKLRPPLREKLLHGRMSAGHARALLGTQDESFQDDLAKRIETEGLSVRTVERLVSNRRNQPKGRPTEKQKSVQAERKSFSHSLQNTLGRPVRIRSQRQGQGGSVTIQYHTIEDLRALITQLSR